MRVVFILMWKYHDNSSCGVIRGYLCGVDAQRDLEMMKEVGDPGREYSVVEVELLA